MREKVLRKKRGISPVIATVLLVAMVVVIGLIIFLWFRGITEEAVTKFGGRNIELVCEDIEFLSDYSIATGILSISNIGNVPIFGMKTKISEQGSHRTLDMKDLPVSWPEIGLRQGGTFSGNIAEFAGAEQVLLIPVLMGTSAQGDQTYVCEDRYGQDLII